MFPLVWPGLSPLALAHATRVRSGGHWLAARLYHRLIRTSDKEVTTLSRSGSSRPAPAWPRRARPPPPNDDAPPVARTRDAPVSWSLSRTLANRGWFLESHSSFRP